jgi:hypothetical protein
MFTIVSPLILRYFETAVNIIKNNLNFVAQTIEGLKDGVLFYANAFIEWWNQPSDFIPNLIKFSEQILYKIIDSTSPYVTLVIDQFYKALHEIIEPNVIKFINLSISTIKNITYYIFESFSFFKEHIDKVMEWWSQPSDIIPNITNYFNERFEKYKSEIYDALKIGKTTFVVTLDTIIKPSLLKLYSMLADELNNNAKYIFDIFVCVKNSFVYHTNEFIEWWNQPSDFISNSIKFLQETFDTISKTVVNITTGVFTTTYETLVKPVLIPLLSNSAKFIIENSNYALEATAGKAVEIYKQVGQDIELIIEKITNFDILKLATSIEEFLVDNWIAKGVVVGISKYFGSTTSEFIMGTLSSKTFDILNENLKQHLYQDKSDTLSSTEEIINKIYLDMEGIHISQHELEESLYNNSNSVEIQSPYMDDTLCYDNVFLNDQLLHTPDTNLDHHIKTSEALIKL